MSKKPKIEIEDDELDADVLVPTPKPEWEERMAKQRAKWREEDRAKYVNPDFDPDANAVWNVYQWRGNVLGWEKVGSAHKKPGRRKPMTLNRLFAGIRQKFGIASNVPVRLISQQDDATRIRDRQYLAPPSRKMTTAPIEPQIKDYRVNGIAKGRTPAAEKLTEATLSQKDKQAVKAIVAGLGSDKKPLKRIGILAAGATTLPGGRITTKAPTKAGLKFAAWGTLQGSWYFLGTSHDPSKQAVQNQMKAQFPAFGNITVVSVSKMSYGLRNQLTDSDLIAGVSTMEPPK